MTDHNTTIPSPDEIASARHRVGQPGSPGFDGAIGGSMAEFSAEYMTYIEDYLDADLMLVADRVMDMLRSMDELHQGFAVSQLDHSLQTATRAERDGASDDMIIASLCHDIGKTFSNMNHPAIAAEMLRPWVSDEAYWVVKYHQDFQGRHYYARIGMDPRAPSPPPRPRALCDRRTVRRRVGPDRVRPRLPERAARALRAARAHGVLAPPRRG